MRLRLCGAVAEGQLVQGMQTVEQNYRRDEDATSRRHRFADFAALPSNLGAIEAGMRFAQMTTPFVAVLGASGWGKSHLLSSVYNYMVLQNLPCNAPIAGITYSSTNGRIDEDLPLLLDDVQDVWGSKRDRNALRDSLRKRVDDGKPTVVAFSDRVCTQDVREFLPRPCKWAFQSIRVPNRDEREMVVRQIADREEVALSQALARLISRHLCGNGRSIHGAVQTLRHVRSDWSQIGALCEACGLLMPYFHGEEGWDPRDVVSDVVADLIANGRLDGVGAEQVCAYILLCDMGLNEYDVATFLGLTPNRVYGLATGLRLQQSEPTISSLVTDCRGAVVRRLAVESY
ncbi:MAG TPA: hypothetical protein VNI20_00530 [Fimbriimonadaceae bacterium]|nr:hypothetical protein [Fimbriimonadaceae bacterium]